MVIFDQLRAHSFALVVARPSFNGAAAWAQNEHDAKVRPGEGACIRFREHYWAGFNVQAETTFPWQPKLRCVIELYPQACRAPFAANAGHAIQSM